METTLYEQFLARAVFRVFQRMDLTVDRNAFKAILRAVTNTIPERPGLYVRIDEALERLVDTYIRGKSAVAPYLTEDLSWKSLNELYYRTHTNQGTMWAVTLRMAHEVEAEEKE